VTGTLQDLAFSYERFRWAPDSFQSFVPNKQTCIVMFLIMFFFLSPMEMEIHSTHIKNGQEVPVSSETNHLGQVKIASSRKAGKWVWVNAKQFRGILKRRVSHLKWEQTRKKLDLHNKL
jgi:hypothetical protein